MYVNDYLDQVTGVRKINWKYGKCRDIMWSSRMNKAEEAI